MIPKRLTIEGLYSYQQRQTIDFEKLLEGQIFGIFGAVGSGKSSILEAMAFAIYSETERLNARGDDRAYNMMNLNSSKLYVDFEFEAGADHARFRCLVEGKRNGKRFGKVNVESSYFSFQNNDWKPITQSEIIETIGLSYEHFRRTVIIPQGKFQEFLQLGNADRTKMLKELFGLEKYDLWGRANSLDNENNLALENISGRLSSSETINEALIQEQQKKLQVVKEQQKLQAEKLKKAESEFQFQEKLKSLFEKLSKIKTDLNTHQQQQADFEKRKTRLQQFVLVQREFKQLFDDRDRLTNESLETKEKLHKVEQELAACLQEEQSLSQQKQDYEINHASKTKWQYALKDWEVVEQILLNEQEEITIAKRLTDAQTYFATQEQKEQTIFAELSALENQIASVKEGLIKQDELLKIQQWDSERKNLKRNIDRLQQQLSEEASLMEALEAKGKQKAKNPEFALQGISNYLLDLVKEQDKLKKQKVEQNHKLDELMVQVKLSEFRENLHEGQPCPLCGSLDHQTTNHEDQNQETDLTTLRKQVVSIDEASDRLKDLNYFLNQAQEKYQAFLEKKNVLTDELNSAQNELEGSKLPETLRQFLNGKSIEEVFSDQKAKGEALEKHIQTQESLRKDQQLLQSEKQKALAGKAALESKKESLESAIRSLSESLSHLSISEVKKQGLVPKQEIQLLTTKLEELERKKEQLQTLEKNLESKKASAAASKTLLSDQIEKKNQDLAEVQDSIQNKLTSFQQSESEIAAVLAQQINPDEEQGAVQQFFEGLNKLITEKQLLEEQLGGEDFDADKFASSETKFLQAKEALGEIQNQLGSEQTTLDHYLKQWEEKKELLEKQQALQKRATLLAEMKRLFKASGFVNYVSSVYLHNLCEAANARFYSLSRQSLKLEINEANQFVIRDFLNNGELRSVKTLSGGQTFQVSLCLALALADSINKQQQQKENFFFLDEGFGTLDKESLQAVIQTLKSLRKENRKVGLISHVEELQQEIDHYLEVDNVEEKGSLIKTSWA